MNIQSISAQTTSSFADMITENVQNRISSSDTSETTQQTNTDIVELTLGYKDTDSNMSSKITQIMNKFNSGKELSISELQYLTANSPDNAQKVRRIMAERAQLEAAMKQAKTKADAMMAATQSMVMVNKSYDNPSVANAHLAQMKDCINTYTQSSDYKSKPDTVVELHEIEKKIQESLHPERSENDEQRTEETEKTDTSDTENAEKADVSDTDKAEKADVSDTDKAVSVSENKPQKTEKPVRKDADTKLSAEERSKINKYKTQKMKKTVSEQKSVETPIFAFDIQA